MFHYVTITTDGIEIGQSDDDAPGSYVAPDAPSILAGYPNHFVAETKEAAVELAAEMLDEIFNEVDGLISELGCV